LLGGDGLLGALSPHLAAAHNPPFPLASELGLCGRACAAGAGARDGNSNGEGDGRRSSNGTRSNNKNSNNNSTSAWTAADALHDWHDVTSSMPDVDVAMAAVAPWRFGSGHAADAVTTDNDNNGDGHDGLAGALCWRGAWGRGPGAKDNGSGGACAGEPQGAHAGVVAWTRGWVCAHQRNSLRLQWPLLLTVEVQGGDGAPAAGAAALWVVAADLVRAVEERRALLAGLFLSVGHGWRDGHGVAAVLRHAGTGGKEKEQQGKEGEEEALLRQLLAGRGGGGTAAAAVGGGRANDATTMAADQSGSWRRFYHGKEEDDDKDGSGGMTAAAGADAPGAQGAVAAHWQPS
jgi:hypothetical protein